jgi:hypothetical protein
MLRNRIQRLLSAQHNLQLPQCSDLFGKKGISALGKLELPDPAGLLLRQQLEMLENLKTRITEDEMALKKMLEASPELEFVKSIPLFGKLFGGNDIGAAAKPQVDNSTIENSSIIEVKNLDALRDVVQELTNAVANLATFNKGTGRYEITTEVGAKSIEEFQAYFYQCKNAPRRRRRMGI